MNERKLATIRKITEINPIPNADKIELAIIDGWQCVVKKGDFKVDDACIYCEIDSIMPSTLPVYEFLQQRKYRIRTIKLRKQISQGLVLPLAKIDNQLYILAEYMLHPTTTGKVNIGDDVTKILGITKWISPSERESEYTGQGKKKYNWFIRYMTRFQWFRKLFKKKSKSFPNWISITDEERLQNMPWILKDKESIYYITEKLDGCFHYKMPILTNKGQLQIGRIVNQKMKVLIASYNEKKEIIEYKKILDYHRIINKNKQLFKIAIANRGKGNKKKFIICTDNHKFLTQDGYKEAKNLYINENVYHIVDKISYDLEQIILGCLLGDSSLNGNKTPGYLTLVMNHSIKQQKYFNYKKQLFGSLFIEQQNAVSGFGSEIKKGIIKSNLSIFNLLNNNCIKNNKKYVSSNWLDNIGPIAIAFWYMDDGSIDNRDEKLQNPRAHFHTQGFNKKTVKNLLYVLNKFGIYGEIHNYSKGYQIDISTKSTEILFSLIAPYICKSMKYKISKKYENLPCIYENISFDTYKSITTTKILSIENVTNKLTDDYRNYFYDLTIENNQNYFCNNILVHNCSATYWYKRNKLFNIFDKDEFGICSRNVRKFKHDGSNWSKYAKENNIEDKLKQFSRKFNIDVCIQGELCGPGIQGNKYNLTKHTLFIFNVYDINKRRYFNLKEMFSFCFNNEFMMTPLLNDNFKLLDTVTEMVELSKGNSIINKKDILREGIVIRSISDHKKSFKIVSPDFLLKYE